MQLKQGNTTRALLFMMVDSGDHLTGKTGLSPTVTISKNGGSFASPSGAITELANGWYKLAADSDDADTLGQLIVHAEDSGADPVDVVFEVVAYNPDDSTKLGLSIFPANFDQMAIISGSGYARVAAELYYDSVADDYRVLPSHLQLLEIDGSGIASAKLADGVTHGGSGSTIQAGTIAASIATVAGNSIITSGTGSHQLTTTSGQVTVGTNNDKTGYALTSAYDSAKTAAQAGDAMALTSPERSTLVAAVWAVTTSTLTTSGTIGKLIVDNLNAAVGGVAASVWAYATRILTAGTNIVLAKGTGVTGLNDLDAAGVRSAVGLASPNVDTQLSAIASSASSSASSAASAATSSASTDGKLTIARAGYLDNLNVGGAVSSQADINALNQSASRRVTLATVPQFERPESGTTAYMLELRTYDGDGAPTNADATPTLMPVGIVSGTLSAYLGSVSNPTTGVYRATYSVSASATTEQIRFDAATVIGGAYFPQAAFSQVVDEVSANFNTTDRSNLTAIANKLPSKSYLAGTNNSTGAVEASAMTGDYAGSVGSVAAAVTVGTNNDKTGYALTAGYDSAKTAAQAGDAMALTSPERSTLVAAVWAVTTSTLTTSGTIGKLIVDNLNAAVGGVAASVWAYATRILTAGTNIVLAKGTGVTGLNDLDAAGVRSAVGLASANVDTQLSAIKAQADKVGTNSGDSSNTVTLQGRVTANVATYAQVAALTAPDNTGIANTLTQATQANTAAAAALSAAQSAQSSASSAAAAANTAATQAANAAAIANTHAVTIASDGLRLLPFGKPTAAPTNLGQALEMLAYGATCKMGGPCSGPGTITLYDADGNAFATRVAQFANGGQTITALVLS